MPPVCRFFLKGYCRYGRSCRFEHPGENDGPTNSSGDGGFSFMKALEEVSSANSPQGFSFTRALEVADNNPAFVNQHHQGQNASYFSQNQYQEYNSPFTNNSGGYFNNNNYYYQNTYTYEQPPYQQQYNHQYASNNNAFSFTQALNLSASQPQSAFNPAAVTSSSFGQFPTSTQIPHNQVEIVMRGGDQAVSEKESELSEIEIKAYQSDKFTFRLIPIKPPPLHLCH